MKRVIATLLLLSAPAQAQVSSTAAPVANSSGSVTNQAVQVVPGEKFCLSIRELQPVKAQASQSVLSSAQLLDGLNPMSPITTSLFMTLSISLARLIRKAIPSQMASPIIRAMSFIIVRFEQDKKTTTRLTAESLPRFRYRWIALISRAAIEQPKSKWRF